MQIRSGNIADSVATLLALVFSLHTCPRLLLPQNLLQLLASSKASYHLRHLLLCNAAHMPFSSSPYRVANANHQSFLFTVSSHSSPSVLASLQSTFYISSDSGSPKRTHFVDSPMGEIIPHLTKPSSPRKTREVSALETGMKSTVSAASTTPGKRVTGFDRPGLELGFTFWIFAAVVCLAYSSSKSLSRDTVFKTLVSVGDEKYPEYKLFGVQVHLGFAKALKSGIECDPQISSSLCYQEPSCFLFSTFAGICSKTLMKFAFGFFSCPFFLFK